MTVRLVIVDDQFLVRSGLAAILSTEDDLDVVGEAADGEQAIAVCHRTRPDVVLMDIRMPVLDGVEATRRITADSDGQAPRVLVLTTFDLDDLVHSALRAGASGFLLKDTPPDDLIRGVRLIAAGESMLAPSATRRLITHFAAQQPPSGTTAQARAAVARLTDRERDVLRLLAWGLSNTEIAATAFVTESTVKTHVGRIFAKLGVRERVQAAVVAYDSGLVIPGEDRPIPGRAAEASGERTPIFSPGRAARQGDQ